MKILEPCSIIELRPGVAKNSFNIATRNRKAWTGIVLAVIIFVYTYMKTTIDATNTVFRAFADETRLRLLNLLLDQELCVCDICEALRVTQPKISRHLAYLRNAKLVTVRSEGKWKYYSVPKRPERLVRTLLDCVGTCLREIDVLQRDLERLALVLRKGECHR